MILLAVFFLAISFFSQASVLIENQLGKRFERLVCVGVGIDPQNDFASREMYPEATLSVAAFDEEVVSVINRCFACCDEVLLSADDHSSVHKSFQEVAGFCENSPCKFPAHCVSGTKGARFVDSLVIGSAFKIFFKGRDKNTEEFGAANAEFGLTGQEYLDGLSSHQKTLKKRRALWSAPLLPMAEYIAEYALKHKDALVVVAFVGVAGEYCVNASILGIIDYLNKHAVSNVFLVAIEDAIPYLDATLKSSVQAEWINAGVTVMTHDEFIKVIKKYNQAF